MVCTSGSSGISIQVPRFKVQKKADKLISWDAWKLGGYKTERLENNLAFQLPSLPAFKL
jgi:hypothetical protein